MHSLEIAAELNFLKPIPDYMDIECTQTILAVVSGEDPPDQGIQRLEAFRRVVIRLMREGLRQEPGCEASDLPYVSLDMKAGEECGETLWKIYAYVTADESGSWRLQISVDDGADHDFIYERSEDALAEVKALLDRETGRWAAQVSFGGKRAGM